MPKIIWTVQRVNHGYQGYVRVNSAVLTDANYQERKEGNQVAIKPN